MSDSATSANPVKTTTTGDVIVQIADGTVTTQLLSIDASGRVTAKITDSSGGVLNSTSGALNIFEQSAGPVTPGTVASKSDLIGGQFNTALPTLTNGQQAAIQLDSSGRLLVNIATSGTLNTQDAADGSITGGATGTKAMLMGGIFNSALPTLTTGQMAGIQVDSSGRILVGSIASALPAGANTIGKVAQDNTVQWLVQGLADGSVGAGTAGTKSTLIGGIFNSALPTLTTGQQAGIQVDSSGRILVGSIASALPAGTNTIGKVAQDNTTQWVTSDLADGPVTPGTVATKSMLQGGQFNTALPTLTNGQQAAIQLDSSGRILVGSIASALPAGTNVIGKVGIQVGGADVAVGNPVPVYLTNTAPGTLVNKYNTTVNLALAGVANHVYTITSGKTFSGRKFWASSSIRIRADVQTSPDGSTYTTFWTGFNSVSFPNIDINLDSLEIQDSGTGSTIRIVITNEDIKIADVFSTISGSEN